ncbi:glycosyltransferase [candidate division KSB1 bacterium]|nr:glycosyltransferase [candidate division KSB1 bacterium]
MKILMIHKFYYVEGGAERYVFNISEILQKKGHTVIPFAMDAPRNFHSDYQEYFCSRFSPDQLLTAKNLSTRLRLAQKIIYNQEAQKKLSALIEKVRPDIAHVHSVYHHISPSVLHTLKQYNLPVMLTLHDYKIVCPNYIFIDGNDNLCEACKGKHFWHAITRKCFRNSYAASFLIAVEAYVNYYLRSYFNNVDLFVSPSHFLAKKIKQYGYQKKPVLVQPYSLNVNEYHPSFKPSDYYVFMGRLTPEKGLYFLLDTAKQITDVKLYIIGSGPMENYLRKRLENEKLSYIKLLGYKTGDELKQIVRNAKFTVVPSLWHDNSPLVIYESFALGKPVIGTRMGGIPELIEDGINGFTFERDDYQSFIKYIRLLAHDNERLVQMGKNAREIAENRYDFEQHYTQLVNLYEYTRNLSKN